MDSGVSVKDSIFVDKSVLLGSVIVDKAEKNRLIPCSYAQRVAIRFGAPFCLCSLGSGSYCRSDGVRLRFKFRFDGFHVVWVCDKLVGLPDLER